MFVAIQTWSGPEIKSMPLRHECNKSRLPAGNHPSCQRSHSATVTSSSIFTCTLFYSLKAKCRNTYAAYSKVSIQFQCIKFSFKWLAKHLFSLILSQSSNHLFLFQFFHKERCTEVSDIKNNPLL